MKLAVGVLALVGLSGNVVAQQSPAWLTDRTDGGALYLQALSPQVLSPQALRPQVPMPATTPAPVFGQMGFFNLTQWENDAQAQSQGMDPWVQDEVARQGRDLQMQIQEARAQGAVFLVWVNVPSYTLRVFRVDTGIQEMSSRVIVGAPHTKTPIFTTSIVNLKFNPDWSPPASIRARYTPPGPRNPLGEIRFSTNNNQNIYLHDTNSRGLFSKEQRALSHGCIRVQNWHELAQVLGGFSPEDVDSYIDGHRTQYVDIPDVRVWVSYQRVDLDEANRLAQFPDIYGRQAIPAQVMLPAPMLIEGLSTPEMAISTDPEDIQDETQTETKEAESGGEGLPSQDPEPQGADPIGADGIEIYIPDHQ